MLFTVARYKTANYSLNWVILKLIWQIIKKSENNKIPIYFLIDHSERFGCYKQAVPVWKETKIETKKVIEISIKIE